MPTETVNVPVESTLLANEAALPEGTEIESLPVSTTVPEPAVFSAEVPLVMLPSISSVPELFWTVRVVGAVTVTGPVPRLRSEVPR